MKETYRKRGEPYDAQEGGVSDTRRRPRGGADAKRAGRFAAGRHGRRRNRGIWAIVLIVSALLAVAIATGYLASGGEVFRTVGLDGSAESGKAQNAAVPAQEESAVEEGQATGAPAADMVLLGEYFTDFAWDPDEARQANLRMAAEAIDNTRLAPGEEFSAIEVLAPLDYETAKVFADGGVSAASGGGLCQVSSTLYMAANYAGLEITERNQHYAEVPYIKPGLDATVWFGFNGTPPLDMKFRNDTDGDVLIREFINEDDFLVVQIWGEEPTGKTISMDSEKVEEDLNKGIKWATYKKVKDEDGKVLEDGLLFESVYSYNPPVPPEIKHETSEPRGAGWVDATNTSGWNNG
ncbi:MAG: VanW family protein [Actinomycetota bacterium]|nr:VanW family protein [Actinomycetota bacterium]